MNMYFYTNCEKKTGHERRFRIGTLLMVLLTFGLWLIVMILYPERCIICGNNFYI